jgi:hypothetical protein
MLTYHVGRLQRDPSVVGHKLPLCSSMVNTSSIHHHYERLITHFQGKERSAARSFGLTGTLPGEVVKICASRAKGWAWPPRA